MPARTGSPWAVRLGMGLLILAGLWAYSPSFSGVLALDDVRAIARNETIRKLWPPAAPLSPPPASTVSGRPVANLSFAVNYALAPADARDTFQAPPGDPVARERLLRNLRGYHLFNLLIHIACALALFGVVRRTLASRVLDARFGDVAAPMALAVAIVWVAHPLTTASVTYVVQRVESLASLFYLLALYCAIRSRGSVWPKTWTAAAVAACTLGIATKEIVVTAPLVVAAWIWLFEPGASVRRDWRLPAALATTWVILAVLVWYEHRGPSLEIGWRASWQYLVTQAEVLTHYLRLAVVPSPLVFLYTWPMHASVLEVAWQVALVSGLAVLTCVGLAARHALSFPGAWFFLILAPSSSLLPIATEVAAEHRMYLPLAAPIGCLVAGAWALGSWAAEMLPSGRRQALPRLKRLAAAIATLCVAAALGTVTRARNRDYWSEERLWADTVAKQPANQRARVAYGSALAAGGKLAEAETHFREAVQLAPGDAIARSRLGSVLAARGKLEEAVRHLEQAVELRPDDADAHRWLGQAYADRGDDRRAVVHLERAVQLMEDSPLVLARLAALLAESSDPSVRNGSRAVALAEQAAAATGRNDPMVLGVLAVAQAASERFGDAAATAVEALRQARARGNAPLAAELERRLAAYGALAAQHPHR
ncbi:MAG: tetratricopeptide repeat protein [Vicinamibacterales bacterium]